MGNLERSNNHTHTINISAEDKSEWDKAMYLGKSSSSLEQELEAEKLLAHANGWNRLGRFSVSVNVPLKDAERIDAGDRIAFNNMKIRDLEAEKKAFVKEVKGQIAELHQETMHLSQTLNEGTRAENKTLPCFYDHKSHERCFVDMDTGEIVRREKAHPEDRQLRLA